MNIEEENNKKILYNNGLKSFRKHDFYDAHEYWEDLWSDYRLPDAKFIQGLIQLSVGYFHISNLNINGARGLLNKCKPKLNEFSPVYKDLDIVLILDSIDKTLEYLNNNNISDFDWNLVPKI
tara:strand:- start:908 stop:1273 length:366 start_codon:yes stop_codon:yes gene_type:complete